MAIDYIIDYDCEPKRRFGADEILERLKGRTRAQTIIRLFRQNGDNRPPQEMGFELVRNTPEGEEETQIIIVQDLLDRAVELDEEAHHCAGCRANVTLSPFGCIEAVQYPLTEAAERWLLERLPGIDSPFLWLLLRQSLQEMGYDGTAVAPLRASGTYFDRTTPLVRDLQDFMIDTNQIFEMLFLVGNIQPPHAGMLLQFFGAVPRATEAAQVVQIMNRQLSAEMIAAQYPFQLTLDPQDDRTVRELKRFLMALHRAWTLDVSVMLDV